MDWSHEFPGLAATTYLNSCSHGLLPRRTRAAIDAHLDRWQLDPSWDAWSRTVEEARRAFARFIGAREDEVAVQASASTGLSALMNAFPSGRIATLDIDFPTAGFVARRQVPRGLKHDHLSLGNVKVDEWAKHVKGAALASVPAVASFNGYRLDAAAFAKKANEMGVPLVIDAFQACGTFPIDVRKLDVDFLVTGVYKWMMAPAGLAFLYARRDHHARVTSTGGWYAATNPGTFDPLDEPAPDARRYQFGGPSVVACAALNASLPILNEIGLAEVERHNRTLVDRIVENARDRKYEVLTPDERASIVTFRVPDLDKALAALAREKVTVNSRLGGIRVSPHFYNTERDVDRLFDVLDAA